MPGNFSGIINISAVNLTLSHTLSRKLGKNVGKDMLCEDVNFTPIFFRKILNIHLIYQRIAKYSHLLLGHII